MNPLAPAAEPVRRGAAFTLIELLVSLAVGLLLVVFLFQLFNVTLAVWQRGESQTDTYRQARAAMQLMTRDVGQTSAPLPHDPFAPPTLTPAGGVAPVLVIDRYPGALPAPQAGDEINEELYCLTNTPNGGASGLCAVGYFCAWMPDLVPADDPQAGQKRASAPRAFALMRQFLGSGRPAVEADPSKGIAVRATVPGLFDRFQAAGGQAALTFLDLYERVPPAQTPDPAKPIGAATELCAFVWDLQFRTPATLQAAASPPEYGALPPYPETLPAYVEIRFKALSAAAARQLEGNPQVDRRTWGNPGNAGSVYQRIIQPGTRQFVARVPVYSGGSVAAAP